MTSKVLHSLTMFHIQYAGEPPSVMFRSRTALQAPQYLPFGRHFPAIGAFRQ
jgi:hypothetical protein